MAFSRTVAHATSADATFSAAGATAWNGTSAHTPAVAGATSGGIPFFDSATTESSSALLAANQLMLGGGAGAAPATLGSLGTTSQVLYGNAAGAPSWGALAVALNNLSAATGAVTLASGNNSGQVWNWALTTDSTIAHTLGETTAATSGTSTSGVPNQAILKLTTLAASTASPLTVYSRGAHVFSVSPSAAQILGTNGAVANPTYAFASSVNSGMYWTGSTLRFAVGGVVGFSVDGSSIYSQDGTAAAPGIRNINVDSGIFFGSIIGHSVGGIENSRFSGSAGASLFQASNAGAVTAGYAMNFRKSRGSVASPTVITSGDTLMTISGYGYLGATNTYREAARIQFDSAGTISDATTGVGSVITIYGKTQGTDVTPAAAMTISGGSTATLQLNGTGMFTANNTVATSITSVGPTGANTTVQEWLTIKNASGTTRYIPCF